MKVFIKDSSADLRDILPEELLEVSINEVPCISKGCDGKLYYFLKQAYDSSTVLCNKCKKSIMLTPKEV